MIALPPPLANVVILFSGNHLDKSTCLAYSVSARWGIILTLTEVAFNEFRSKHGPARAPNAGLIKNEGESTPMDGSNALSVWVDGPIDSKAERPAMPLVDDTMANDRRLWAVRSEDVVHAHEKCDFGATLETGVIKHTNLTGGKPAFSAGELIFVDEATILVNGCSGRYGPRSAAEMEDVAKSFRKSGYHVWSAGYDDEAGRPYPFFGVDPVWVAA